MSMDHDTLTALSCLIFGKANPEQQKLLFKYICKLQHENKPPRKGDGVLKRNVTIATIINYMKSVGEHISDHQACREYKEVTGIDCELSTVVREFRKWKAQPEEEKQKDFKRFLDNLPLPPNKNGF